MTKEGKERRKSLIFIACFNWSCCVRSFKFTDNFYVSSEAKNKEKLRNFRWNFLNLEGVKKQLKLKVIFEIILRAN